MIYQYWLANIKTLSPSQQYQLYLKFGSAAVIYQASEKMLMESGIDSDIIKRVIEHRLHFDLEKEWISFQQTGIDFTTVEQDSYPIRLRHIYAPPYALFYKGHLPNENKKAIAIVGSRNRSAYGQAAALELGRMLGAYDINVISGLARGIDSDGHKGALQGNAKTFGILGCGVDVVYPKGNAFLYEEILLHNGGIISEFPLGTQALKMNFPRRNRIISGLSDCVVVIEAKMKSGSLITADFAMEQGKELYALPGRISDPLSSGTNDLIRQGCGIYLTPEELLLNLGIDTKGKLSKEAQNKNALEKEELLLYSLIDFVPINIGTLMEKTGFSISKVLTILDELVKKDLIKEQPLTYYVRTKIS